MLDVRFTDTLVNRTTVESARPMNALDIFRSMTTKCAFLGAAVGGVLHWGDSDGCMIPAPIIGIGYSIVWGVCGFVIGGVLSPVAVVVEQKRQQDREAIWKRSDGNVEMKSDLLRSSAEPGHQLLRPCNCPGSLKPDHLLRPSSIPPGTSTAK